MSDWPQGAFDVHVHAGPSLFERWGDAWDLAVACSEAGMRGFVLKSHRTSTVEQAALLQPRFPSLRIYGGLALNHFVGGVNPVAVDAALRLGARIIWLPTLHSSYHAEKCGCLGGFGFQKSKATDGPPVDGIRLTDERGELLPNVKAVVELMTGKDAALATGHASPDEIFALSRFIRHEHKKVRLLVNHVHFMAPGLKADAIRELANDETWFETVQLCISKLVASTTLDQVAADLLALPNARWVIASDSGQRANLRAPAALTEMAAGLAARGVPEARIRTMMSDEPLRVVGAA